MAPTEILARQHFARSSAFAASRAEARAADRPRQGRRAGQTLDALASGAIDIIIGTHALFQEAVAFRDLGLAVVDEQHRFGVHQRLALGDKGERADILVMTATPIPRSLVLTYFGDMDVSAIREKPRGASRSRPARCPWSGIGELIDGSARAIATGAQAFWVCPLVEESELVDLAAAEERFADLRQYSSAIRSASCMAR